MEKYRGPFHWDPKRGQREVAGEFSVPDSEGVVFEVAGHRAFPRSKKKESLKFDELEALKEAILILASATVHNGAALAQPRRSAGTERSEEILRCTGWCSSGCHGLFDRVAFRSSARTVRVVWRDSTACCWTGSMASHGDEITALSRAQIGRCVPTPSWLAFHRQQFHCWYSTSCLRTRLREPGCADGVDALYFPLQACIKKLTAERATSLITEVEKVSHSYCSSVFSLASKCRRSTTSTLP